MQTSRKSSRKSPKKHTTRGRKTPHQGGGSGRAPWVTAGLLVAGVMLFMWADRRFFSEQRGVTGSEEQLYPLGGSEPAGDSGGAESGQQGQVEAPAVQEVQSSTGSVFSEPEAPVIIGDVPGGWKVDTATDIKAKFGPYPVPDGEDITFIVPVYVLSPDSGVEGVYIIEPGRTGEGEDEGGTVGAVLGRLKTELGAVDGAMRALSKAIGHLRPPVEAPAAEAGDDVQAGESDGDGAEAGGAAGTGGGGAEG